MEGFPSVGQVTDATAVLLVQCDVAARVYTVALAHGSASVTSHDVMNGVGPGGIAAAVVASAAPVHGEAETTIEVTLSGLSAVTIYDVWLVAIDDEGNLQDRPTTLPVTTNHDMTPPSWEQGFPTMDASSLTDKGADLLLQVDEPAEVTIVLLRGLPPSTLPSATDVDSGAFAQAMASSLVSSATITTSHAGPPATRVPFVLLQPLSSYWCVLAVRDTAAKRNLAPSVEVVTFETPADEFPPEVLPGYPELQPGERSVSTTWALSEAGEVVVLVLPVAAPAPSVQDLFAASHATGWAGSRVVDAAAEEVQWDVTGLQPETTYALFWASEDGHGNCNLQPSVVYFVTAQGERCVLPVFA